MTTLTVREILEQTIRQLGGDGLCNRDMRCRCNTQELMDCPRCDDYPGIQGACEIAKDGVPVDFEECKNGSTNS